MGDLADALNSNGEKGKVGETVERNRRKVEHRSDKVKRLLK